MKQELKLSVATVKVIPEGMPLPMAKVCGCGFQMYKTDSDTVVCNQGHLWFNCACGSTKVVLRGKHGF